MDNDVFFVKYEGNQPVKIKTHYNEKGERREWPLSDVADMIGAFLPGVSPAGLGQYTLHAVVDSVEGSALEPDLLVPDLTAGQTAKSALIIKSHNLRFIKSQNDMEVNGSH
ncbi:hypothetical protein HDU84_000375, partial [Entophlyctis sp. JEL0112]